MPYPELPVWYEFHSPKVY